MKLYGFQVYSSVTRHLTTALHVRHPKSVLSVATCLSPLTLVPSSLPASPLVTTVLPSVSRRFCLVRLVLSVLYATWEQNRKVLTYSAWHGSVRIHPHRRRRQFGPSSRLSDVPWRVCTAFIRHLSEDTWLFPRLGHCEQCCREYWGAYIFMGKSFQVFWVDTQ